MTCVFWKEGASKDYWGAWSPEGCLTEQPSPSQVLCRCNHLTYFAVLMVCVYPAWLRVVRAAEGPLSRTEEKGESYCKGQKNPTQMALREKKRNLWVHVSEKAGLGFRYGLIQGLHSTKIGLYFSLSIILVLC